MMMRMAFFFVWFSLGVLPINAAVGGELFTAHLMEESPGQFIQVGGATDPFAAMGQILQLETNHLIALGVGIGIGAAVIAPELGVGEITGIVIGVIVGDLIYRYTMAPDKKEGWFDGWFSGSSH
jgi:hypothetical protein